MCNLVLVEVFKTFNELMEVCSNELHVFVFLKKLEIFFEIPKRSQFHHNVRAPLHLVLNSKLIIVRGLDDLDDVGVVKSAKPGLMEI